MEATIIKWFLDKLQKIILRQSTIEKNKQKRVIEYLEECIAKFHTIMDHEIRNRNEVEYAHQWLKRAHQDIYNQVENIVTPKECDIIRQSLMSARVYYRANMYGCVGDGAAIQKDYTERLSKYTHHVYEQKEMRENSNEIVLVELVRDGRALGQDERKDKLARIKTVCMEDMTRIESIKEVAKSRLVFMI